MTSISLKSSILTLNNMAIFKFYCKSCELLFEKDSDWFTVSYANVLETKCPQCWDEVNNCGSNK